MSVEVVTVSAGEVWVLLLFAVAILVAGLYPFFRGIFDLTMLHRQMADCFVCQIAGIKTEAIYQVGPWYFRRFVCKDHGEAFDGIEGTQAEAEIRAEGGIQ